MSAHPQTITTDALRKLAEAINKAGISEDYLLAVRLFIDPARAASPAWADELDRLRAAEVAGKARDVDWRHDVESLSYMTALEALQIIAGEIRCADNLMGNDDLARMALIEMRKPAARADIARLTDAGANKDYPDECHASHKRVRSSDASTFDMICNDCGARDVTGGGWGGLRKPCTVAPPPPAAADRGVPGQVTDAMVEAFGKAHCEDQWETFKFGLGDVTVCNRIKAGIRAALATAPKAEDVRRPEKDEATRALEDAYGKDWRKVLYEVVNGPAQ